MHKLAVLATLLLALPAAKPAPDGGAGAFDESREYWRGQTI